MDSKYRQIVERYRKHRRAFIEEKLMPTEAELLASQLAIAETLPIPALTPKKNQPNKIEEVKVYALNCQKIKKIEDFTIDLDIRTTNEKICLLELNGEAALRLLFFLKLLLSSKVDGQGYSQETLQEMEAERLKNANIDLEERQNSTALHRSINQKLKRRTGLKEFIKNTAGRNTHANWVLQASRSQVQFEDKNFQNILSKF